MQDIMISWYRKLKTRSLQNENQLHWENQIGEIIPKLNLIWLGIRSLLLRASVELLKKAHFA
jgi:hypothetical protein